jgi:hypothetical protein
MNKAENSGSVRGRPFRKGQSGNPGGRPRSYAEFRAAAISHSEEALATLVGLMRSAENDTVRLAACREILDRAFGKAPISADLTITPGDDDRPKPDYSKLTDDEFDALDALLTKALDDPCPVYD